jgi:glycosyltransferase involved in cell wall biosynthesis
MSDPTVSVVIPVYDRTEYLRMAVESVCRQTFADWELILADDGSREETRAYLRSLDDPRITVLWLAHTGIPSAPRNAGIRRARGQYIAFLDSDDRWEPTKLAAQVEALRACRSCRWCYTMPGLMDANGRPLSRDGHAPFVAYTTDIVERVLRHEAQIAIPTVMAERLLITKVGGFDERQRFAEDHDLIVRLALASDVAVVNEPLTVIRIGNRISIGNDKIGAYEGWVRFYGKLATSLPSAEGRAIARRQRFDRTLTLARLYAGAGRTRDAVQALWGGAGSVWRYPGWWWRTAKTAVRCAWS